MKINKWSHVLIGVGLISMPAIVAAEEKMNAVQTALTSTTLSGYVDTSAILNIGHGYYNLPGHVYDTADMQNGFNLDVVSLTLAKPLDEKEWAAGYNLQMLFGPGATKRGTGSFIPGTVNNPSAAGGANQPSGGDFAFNEAYVALRVPVGNGIDFKVGQFGTYNGYEAYDTYKDPTWSRSYGFYIESSAHTGISGSYKFSDAVTLMLGVGNMAGFNNQANAKYALNETKKAFLSMITLTAPESFGFLKGASLSAGYTGGVNGPYNSWMQENFYVGASIPTPVAGLSVGLAYDYTVGSAFQDSYAQALAGYVVYQATEKLKLAARADFGWGSDTSYGYWASTAGANQLFSLTLNADYALWKNVVSRVELRWDDCLTGDTPFGGTIASTPTTNNGTEKNDVSLILNITYLF